jgi:hypothetical protein
MTCLIGVSSDPIGTSSPRTPAQPVVEHACAAGNNLLLKRLTDTGVPAGEAELLITREWAILAGENDYTTGTFEQITGRPPRPVAEFLHDNRAKFV